jgi:endonuclease/exonuclease/phosphatase family metal-dependent hydrolase
MAFSGYPDRSRSVARRTGPLLASPWLLRLASYNLLHGISLRTGRVDLPSAAEAIAALGADVVALQEVDRGLPRTDAQDQVAELAALTGMHGLFTPALLGDPGTRWRAVAGDDTGEPGYGVGLLSLLPLTAPQRIALPGGGDGERVRSASPQNPGWDREPRVALAVTLDAGGRAVRIATAHLSYLPWRGLAQLRALLAAIQGPPALPTVLTGDLNLPALGVRALVRGGWRHAHGFPTYPAWSPRIQPDQLLVHGPLAVRDVTVGPQGPGDHLPLAATLELGVASR